MPIFGRIEPILAPDPQEPITNPPVVNQVTDNRVTSLEELEEGVNKLRSISIPSILMAILLPLFIVSSVMIILHWSKRKRVSQVLEVFLFIGMPFGGCILLCTVVFYYTECYHCTTRQYLMSLDPSRDHVSKLKQAIPYVLIKVECYHWKERVNSCDRVVTFKDTT